LKGDHIIEYEGYIRDGQELNIVMHKSSGSLRSLMNENIRWNKAKVLKLLIQVTSSMLKLDKKFIRHLDLKPENILYEKEDYYKICDFGCAELFDSELSINQHKSLYFGTPRYLPPEVSLGYHETKKNSTDIWSMGVIIYELIYGAHPLIFEE
jgi:serine/threonine protein kinase